MPISSYPYEFWDKPTIRTDGMHAGPQKTTSAREHELGRLPVGGTAGRAACGMRT